MTALFIVGAIASLLLLDFGFVVLRRQRTGAAVRSVAEALDTDGPAPPPGRFLSPGHTTVTLAPVTPR